MTDALRPERALAGAVIEKALTDAQLPHLASWRAMGPCPNCDLAAEARDYLLRRMWLLDDLWGSILRPALAEQAWKTRVREMLPPRRCQRTKP